MEGSGSSTSGIPFTIAEPSSQPAVKKRRETFSALLLLFDENRSANGTSVGVLVDLLLLFVFPDVVVAVTVSQFRFADSPRTLDQPRPSRPLSAQPAPLL